MSRDASLKAECTPAGYKLLDRTRSARRQGGGTALLCRHCFTLKCNSSGEVSSFEFSDWNLSSNGIRQRIIHIYRPPYSKNHTASVSTFLEQFSSLLEPILICKEPLITTGDFNIHVDIPSESLQFTEPFHVSYPACESANSWEGAHPWSNNDSVFRRYYPLRTCYCSFILGPFLYLLQSLSF